MPKIPSYQITDLAKAINPECRLEFVGIRPGEKLHEEMITSTDALNTVEFQDYYVILPATPLWDIEKFRNESNHYIGNMCKLGLSYNSGANEHFLSVVELRELIENHILGA